MFGKVKELKKRNEDLLNELEIQKENLARMETSYNLLLEKYDITCKQRDEYKEKINSIKEKNRDRQAKYRAKKKVGK